MSDLLDQLLELPPEKRKAAMETMSPSALAVVREAAKRKDFERYRDDAAEFITDRLGETLWSKQHEICQALNTHGAVAVPACHAPGKSHLAARIVAWWTMSWPVGTAQAITTATNFRTVRNQLWPHIRRVQKKHKLPGRCNLTEWWIGEELVSYGFASAEQDPEGIQGIHVPHLLVVVDEAGGISHQLGAAFDSLSSTKNVRLLLIGNPSIDEEDTWFQRCCESTDYKTIRLPADATPNFTGEEAGDCHSCTDSEHRPHSVAEHLTDPSWVVKVERDYGPDSPYVEARVHARFPDIVTNRTIPTSWAEMAKENDTVMEGRQVRLGVDVASDGGDELAIARMDGFHIRLVHRSSGAANANATDVAKIILDEIREAEKAQKLLDPDGQVRVKVDADGLGWGVVSTLQTWGLESLHNSVIVPVKSGMTARDPEKFSNQKAEMWWGFRQSLQPEEGSEAGEYWLDVDDVSIAQITSPKYRSDSKGRVVIESKKELRQRGLRSPDRAEAIVLAPYEPPRAKKRVRLIV